MGNWKVILYWQNLELGEVHIRRGIFKGDSFSPLVPALGFIPLRSILRKVEAIYEFPESKEQINRAFNMDDLKSYNTEEKELDSLVLTVSIFSNDIGMFWYVLKIM